MNPYRTAPPRAPSRRSFFYRVVDALMIPGAFVVTILVGASPACTPVARQQAGAVISTVAPALCTGLTPLFGSDGAFAGSVCADLSRAFGSLLLASASTSQPSLVRVAAHPHACTAVRLADVDPSRDPGEIVCAEAFGGVDAAKEAIDKALATGRAR